MGYSLSLTHKAKTDLDNIRDYYDEQSFDIGIEFYLEFLSFIDVIENHPERYPPLLLPTRRAMMKKFPYYIFYITEEKNKTVKVLGIIHSRRNPEYIKKRLNL